MTDDHKSQIRALEESVANYRNALDWISNRIPPWEPPLIVMREEYMSDRSAREIAHDAIACARAALDSAGTNKAQTGKE